MSDVKYKYYLLKKCWISRLEKNQYILRDKEFFIDGVWKCDDELNNVLNDCIMGCSDSSVFDYEEVSEEEALKQIALANSILSEKQILYAKECYLFGDKILYIVVDKDGDVFVYDLESKSWSQRSSESFWDSWDLDSSLFLPINSVETIRMIYETNRIVEL